MNPSGLRIEEKKSADHDAYNNEERSLSSYKSTQSSRSSVLQRAREYNRRIDEQNMRRSKSLERASSDAGGSSIVSGTITMTSGSRRSVSAGRAGPVAGNRTSTRERAMASVRKETGSNGMHTSTSNSKMTPRRTVPATPTDQTVLTESYASTSYHSSPRMTTPSRRPAADVPASSRSTTTMEPYNRTMTTPNRQQPIQQVRSQPSPQQQHRPTVASSPPEPPLPAQHRSASMNRTTASSRTLPANNLTTTATATASASPSSHPSVRNNGNNNSRRYSEQTNSSSPPQQHHDMGGGGVSPDILVDALSGHEDGLLAIAERLMEHYDGGYDVMGEAIIDAFADVQKLFQHVVEAAHMEGAAFEASRRDDEMDELKRLVASGQGHLLLADMGGNEQAKPAASPAGPVRLDEFLDQDVKDIMTDAVRKGTQLRDTNKHGECLQLYLRACQNASSLLPVDSDHRGRLQVAMDRAVEMSPDRACAILRYAMDDVIRSGMKAGRTPMKETTKRSDLVLNRPTNSMVGNGLGGHAGALQSADEALNSLIEEMKEILTAPVYDDTPLQAVAKRFWAALHDSQKLQQKNEDRLEQQLAKLKGEFLLAKSEWEEKLSQANEQAHLYKSKCDKLRKEAMKGENYMDHARQFASRLNDSDMDISTIYGSVKSGTSGRGASSVASLGSGLAQQAKTIVNSMNSFNCANMNERSGPSMPGYDGGPDIPFDRSGSMERTSSTSERSRTPVATRTPATAGRSRTPIATRTPAGSKAFQDYSRSPQRIDV